MVLWTGILSKLCSMGNVLGFWTIQLFVSMQIFPQPCTLIRTKPTRWVLEVEKLWYNSGMQGEVTSVHKTGYYVSRDIKPLPRNKKTDSKIPVFCIINNSYKHQSHQLWVTGLNWCKGTSNTSLWMCCHAKTLLPDMTIIKENIRVLRQM